MDGSHVLLEELEGAAVKAAVGAKHITQSIHYRGAATVFEVSPIFVAEILGP